MTNDRSGTAGHKASRSRSGPRWLLASGTVLAVICGSGVARADKIKNGTAVFSGLDKITGRIISFQAAMGETVQFGSLKVTSRVCYTRPPTETPQTDTFIEVDEVSAGNDDKRIFSGWIYAASPGLHGIEHPIYDIWLTDCKNPGETIAEAPQTADAEDPGAVPSGSAPPGAASAPAGAASAPPGAASAPAGAASAPAGVAVSPAIPAPPSRSAPIPKPKRVARPAPPPPPDLQAEHREPTQRFFPTSQYPAETFGKDPGGSHSR